MPLLNRRQLLRASIAAPTLLAAPFDLLAAKYDVVIRGGRVIDPAQHLDLRLDIAIRDGKIAALKPKLDASAGKEAFDATGKLVMPGLIDIHTHLADKAMPPATCLQDGVTTLVDAGSTGYENVDDLVKIVQNTPIRARILINIARRGVDPKGELMDLKNVNVAATQSAIERNRQWVIGIKARLSRNVAGENDMAALRLAREVADAAKVPIMIHVGDTFTPLTEIVGVLRPGDIVTHMYAPAPHGILGENGKIYPEILNARKRGVIFDFGNGRNMHFDWSTARYAIDEDFLPDTISTDMTLAARTNQVFNLPTVMSKLLSLGMRLDQVIACVTENAAHVFPEFNANGTLKHGAVADVTVLDLKDGDFEFVDNYGGKRNGRQKLLPDTVFVAGKRVTA